MPGRMIALEYGNALDSAAGAVHGLAMPELDRAVPAVAAAVERIEAERGDGKHRYRDLPTDTAMLRQVEAVAKRRKVGVENLVVLGIGGSALGNIALQTALNAPSHNLLPAAKRRGPRLFVIDNVDPVQFADLLDVLGPALRKTLFNVISKSGETAETASQFLVVRDLLARKIGAKNVAKHLLVTTDPDGGTLRSQAIAEGYERLPVPPGVGGRFSVLSAVGLLSAAMCGINIRKLAAGAAEMGRRVANRNVKQNPAAMLALLLHAFYLRGKRMHVLMPYSFQLRDLADWYRQLWAESLGKCRDRQGRSVIVGPTPMRALGTTDQHSQVQLFREGPNDKVFIFLEVEKFARDVKLPRGRTPGMPPTPDAAQYLLGSSLGNLLNAEKVA
ncbi:MAG: glucose-6-phosphate isomerase, partial [Planctomycetes bacterium]|nr:glucose-6-phosphate isomerase [Planctomycetota bacterium]